MKYFISIYLLLILTFTCTFAQKKNSVQESVDRMKEISFYTDYVWKDKSSKNTDGSVYRSKLRKEKELNGVVSVNRSFDSTDKKGELKPFLTGVSGFDPVEKKIRFLDFSRDGMMVEGTIDLIDEYTIQYDFEFAYPENKRKLKGRDVLKFNNSKTEFVWTTYLKSKDGQFKKLNETVLVRGKKVNSN